MRVARTRGLEALLALHQGRGRAPQLPAKAQTQPAWLPLPSFTTADNGTQRTVTDLSATGGTKFYRVEITLP